MSVWSNIHSMICAPSGCLAARAGMEEFSELGGGYARLAQLRALPCGPYALQFSPARALFLSVLPPPPPPPQQQQQQQQAAAFCLGSSRRRLVQVTCSMIAVYALGL